MNPNIKEFVTRRFQEAKGGRNPVVIFAEINGYLEGMRDAGEISPLKYIDIYCEVGIRLVKAIKPDVGSDQEAVEIMKSWEIAMDSVKVQTQEAEKEG